MNVLKQLAAILTCMTLLCSGCTGASGRSLTLWVITDPHFLSEELFTVSSPSFQNILSSTGEKMVEYMPALMQEFENRAAAGHPDAILIPGDLTFNGEYESLRDLKTLLRRILDEGIPVCVIPGNHDIHYPYAAAFTGDGAFGVRPVTQQEFTEEMAEFGYAQALSHAPDSFSYTIPLADDLWLLAIDANTEAEPGSVTAATLVWMEEQLRKADEQNIHVISMTHQNVLPQSDFMAQGYVITNHESVAAILESGNTLLNLSGHSHLQHTSSDGILTDICTESAAIYPMGYGILTIQENHKDFTYEKAQFSAYQEEGRDRLRTTIHNSAAEAIREIGLSHSDQEAMLEFAEEVNELYFTGRLTDSSELLSRREYALFQNYASDTGLYRYLSSILSEYDPN